MLFDVIIIAIAFYVTVKIAGAVIRKGSNVIGHHANHLLKKGD